MIDLTQFGIYDYTIEFEKLKVIFMSKKQKLLNAYSTDGVISLDNLEKYQSIENHIVKEVNSNRKGWAIICMVTKYDEYTIIVNTDNLVAVNKDCKDDALHLEYSDDTNNSFSIPSFEEYPDGINKLFDILSQRILEKRKMF